MFTCVTYAKPRAVIQWTNNGTVLTNLYKNGQTKIIITNNTNGDCEFNDPLDQCETSSTLEIFYAHPADNGEYVCGASNKVGYLEKSAILSVDDDGMYVLF